VMLGGSSSGPTPADKLQYEPSSIGLASARATAARFMPSMMNSHSPAGNGLDDSAVLPM
jgi:hypothetical protein